MHTFLASLTSAMLLIQALTGLCCHRPYNVSLGVPAARQAADCANCCRHHSEPPERPVKCSKCMGVCTYVPPQRTEIDSHQSTALGDVADEVGVADFSGTSQPDRPWGLLKLEPPLRLHLMHQILVV